METFECKHAQKGITIPVQEYKDLLRAEMERDILEELLSGDHKYYAEDVLAALKKSRRTHRPHRPHHCPLVGAIRFTVGYSEEGESGDNKPAKEQPASDSQADTESEAEATTSSEKASE